MSNLPKTIKISELPEISSINDTDIFIVENSSVTNKITGKNLIAYIKNHGEISDYYVPQSSIDVANGIASLDASRKIPSENINFGTISNTVFDGGRGKALEDGLDAHLLDTNDPHGANTYTDNKIAELINGAPTTLDTLKEIADAMAENEDVIEALEVTIGKKTNQDDFLSHTNDSTKHHSHSNKSILDIITAEKIALWDSGTGGGDVSSEEIENIINGTTPVAKATDADTVNGFKVYKSLSELGLTEATATAEAIVNAMADNSVLLHKLGGSATSATLQFPYNYSMFRVTKLNTSYASFKCIGTGSALIQYGYYNGGTSTKWSGWSTKFLPLTGGKLTEQMEVEASNAVPLIVTNKETNAQNSFIEFRAKNAETGVSTVLGYLGFVGAENPVYSYNGNRRKLLHTGNCHDYTVELIAGTQTAATGSWTGVTKSATLYHGKQILYQLPYAGSGNATLNLTLSGGGTTGAINCYYSGTTRLTTHYGAGSTIRLVYLVNHNVNGTKYTGWWADANYDSGNTKVTISANAPTSSTAYYPLFHTSTSGTTTVTANAGTKYYHLTGTTSTIGFNQLTLGNGIASGTAGNSTGKIALYGTNTYYTMLQPGATTANRTITLPNATGTVVTTGNLTLPASTAYTTNQLRNSVFTTTDPGAGVTTSYANGSIICVYE